MESLKSELIESYKEIKSSLISNYLKTLDSKLVQKSVRYRLLFDHSTLGIYYYYIENNTYNSKQEFSTIGMISIYLYETGLSRWLGYGIRYITYTLISDNESLINYISNMKIFPDDKKTLLKTGNCLCLAFLALIRKDFEEVQVYLDLIRKLSMKSKATIYDSIYVDLLEAFLKRDSDLLNYSLRNLEKKRIKKSRIKYLNDEKYISVISSGFAKLGLRFNMEVDEISEYVPLAVLNSPPNDRYEVPYLFLKEHFNLEKLNWIYKPVG